jgi:hypothetical protein
MKKEEEFYKKELNLIKEKLSEVKKKININRQKNKKLRDKREIEDEFKDLKTIIKGLELREKIFKSIISEKIENF